MAPKNATECATFPLKPGCNIDDPTTTAGKIWQDTMTIVLSQSGVQRAFYGTEVENPNVLRLLVQWDDYQDHMNFINSNEYGPMLSNFRAIVEGPPILWHAKLADHPGHDALTNTRSPVTEYLTIAFPASYSSAAQENFHEKHAKALIEGGRKDGAPITGFTSGWSVEKDVPAEKSKDGTRLYTAFIGWPSVDEHMKFRETQFFKDNIHLLREAPELVEVSVRHVSFTELQAPHSGASGVAVGQTAQEEVLNPQ